MYCPICFNDTLKLASSGVVKFTFDGKSMSTSQFYYNITQDTQSRLKAKIKAVIEEYFEYYSSFQNQSEIKRVTLSSIDFKCSNRCIIKVDNRVSVLGLLIEQSEVDKILKSEAKKRGIPLNASIQYS